MLTDEEIVARVQAGETELFELIFDRHYARIERSARGLGLPEPELEDVVAETFLRAFAGIRSFQVAAGKRYLPYLYAIARNLCTDRLRQRQRARLAICLEDVEIAGIPDESEQAAPLTALLKREQLDRIRAALATLPPADREIIALSYDRDLSSKEIMAVMQKPSVTAVTTHLHKAMKKLRALVGSEGAEGDQWSGKRDAGFRTTRLESQVGSLRRRQGGEEPKAVLLQSCPYS
jgi:RNA polymerase sigma-70 factor (ECF subfamily)